MARHFHLITVSVVLLTVGHVTAEVIPINPGDFTPAATVETFENILNVTIPPAISPISGHMPFPYDFGSGVSLIAGAPLPDGYVDIVDFQFDSPPATFGWGLGATSIWTGIELPSGTAVLGHSNVVTPDPPYSPMVFEFANPVARLGAYCEAFIDTMPGTGEVSIEAFDANGASLGSIVAMTDGAGWDRFGNYYGPVDSWIGLETGDGQPLIKQIAVSGTSMVMDDLTFEVPEPASLAMLVVAMFWLRKR